MDFKQIAETPITNISSLLGLVLTEKQTEFGAQLVGQCPISKGTNPTAFKITPSKNRFICFCSDCKKLPKPGGDCIELLARVRRISTREAAGIISGADKAADTPAQKQEVPAPSQPTGFDPLSFLAHLDMTHEALTELGLSPDTLKAFKAGYCTKPSLRNRLAVGMVDAQGTLTGFVGVALKGEEPRLQFPKGVKIPFYVCVQLVEEGELHVFNDILQAMSAYEDGLRSMLVLLQPLIPDVLKCLWALMEHRKVMTLEICY